MKKEDCKWNFEWDYKKYLEYKKEGIYPESALQEDWNNTLVTKINQCSATIFKASMAGGATTIAIHSNLIPIFESLEYYDITNKTLGGRYIVEIDDNLEPNVIYAYRNWPSIRVLGGLDENGFASTIDIPISECTAEELKENAYNTSGYIEILNYEKICR